MPSTDEATMIAVTLAIARRWGRKRRPMRRSDTLRAWAFSAGVTVRAVLVGGAPTGLLSTVFNEEVTSQ